MAGSLPLLQHNTLQSLSLRVGSSSRALPCPPLQQKTKVVVAVLPCPAGCRKICQTVEGLKRGYPGLDLVIFPGESA